MCHMGMGKGVFVAFIVMLASCTVRAYVEEVNGIEWNYIVSAGQASIFNPSYSSAIPQTTTGAIVIPPTLGGYPVTSIGNVAFIACSGITSVTIPASVTSIGDYAFAACSGIRSVTVPQCVCSTQLSAVFPTAYQLITDVVVSDGVTSIEDFAFENCSSLAHVTIPDSVVEIGEGAFDGCGDALFDMATIPGVKIIDGWVVGYADGGVGDLNLDGVRGVGNYAFEEYGGLRSVILGGGVVHIGDGAFSSCDGLTNVTIGSGVATIGEWAFESCVVLASVTIPANVADIGYGAFCYCSGLTNVIFMGNAPSAGDYAFGSVGANCTASVYPSKWQGVEEGQSWHDLIVRFMEEAGNDLDYEIVGFAVETVVQDGVSVRRMIVGVVAKDGEEIVQGDAAKVATMFEATSDLNDWDGAAKLAPTVEVLESDGATMRFRVTPGDGTVSSAFLRIRK